MIPMLPVMNISWPAITRGLDRVSRIRFATLAESWTSLYLRQQYRKLVSAQPRNAVRKLRLYMTGRFIAFANAFLYPLGNALEQQVSHFIAESVVYPFESVQVKKQRGNIAPVTLCMGNSLSQMVLERISIEQSGQDIVSKPGEICAPRFFFAP